MEYFPLINCEGPHHSDALVFDVDFENRLAVGTMS